MANTSLIIATYLTYVSILFLTSFLRVSNCTGGECGCSPSPAPPPSPELLPFKDLRLATVYPIIQTFKNTITSDPFNYTKTWVGPDICNYKGFYCDIPPDNDSAIALAGIDFNGFGLTAPSLDGFIDQLPDLAIFHANSNNFSGTISPKLATLPFFYELDISNNKFVGNFPTSVLKLTNLSFLDIRFNSFTGSVPPEVFNQRLDVLFLNNNNFMQRIPDNLGSSPVLYLTFANNKFTGPIPRSIFNTSATLTEILLLNNQLTGCVPYEIGFLKELVVFDASNNLLTGPLPFSLGCLTKIEQLNISGNFLYGQVPEVVCALENLESLTLSNNYFTRIGPLCRKLVKRGIVDVRKNCIYDLPEQRSWHECFFFALHPKYYCPYSWTFWFIPCFHHNVTPPGFPHPRPRRNLISYKTLRRERV